MTARATEPDVTVIAERAALVLDRVHELRVWANARIMWCLQLEREERTVSDDPTEHIAAHAERRALNAVLRILDGAPAAEVVPA